MGIVIRNRSVSHHPMARLLVTLVVIASVSSAAGESAVFDNRTRHAVPTYKLNLDLPQRNRWSHIIKDFKSFAPQILAYLESNIPKWAIPIIKTIAKDIRPYFTDYGDEMLGIAEAFDLDVGYVTALNLVYQLESLGLNCSNWNNTGPTRKDDPGCMKIDPKQDWCYCHDKKEQPYIDPMTGILQPPKFRAANLSAAATPIVRGMCTSVVAQSTDGHVIHGRNLDWNIPRILREMVIDIEFQRGNHTILQALVLLASSMAKFLAQMDGRYPWMPVEKVGKCSKTY